MKHRILIVDDEPSLRRTLERALLADGYEVSTAADPQSAYTILEHTTVDAVLLDFRMPLLAGDALAVAIVHRWPYLTRRIMLMSGDPWAAAAAWPAELRGTPVLPKPFSLEALGDALGALIRGAAEREPRRRNGHE